MLMFKHHQKWKFRINGRIGISELEERAGGRYVTFNTFISSIKPVGSIYLVITEYVRIPSSIPWEMLVWSEEYCSTSDVRDHGTKKNVIVISAHIILK